MGPDCDHLSYDKLWPEEVSHQSLSLNVPLPRTVHTNMCITYLGCLQSYRIYQVQHSTFLIFEISHL